MSWWKAGWDKAGSIIQAIGIGFSVLLSFIVIFSLFSWAVLHILPAPLSWQLWSNTLSAVGVYAGPTPESVRPSTGTLNLEERDALSNFDQVTAWVLACSGGASVDQLPDDLRRVVDRNSGYNGNLDYGGGVGAFDRSSVVPTKVTINGAQRRIAYLASALSAQRIQLQDSVAEGFKKLQAATLITILAGLLTTVLVTLSNTTPGSSTLALGIFTVGQLIKTLAVVMPAIGTAIAALVAFYNPSDGYYRAKQALISAGQLERQIADGISGQECPSDGPTGQKWVALNQKLDAWQDQFNGIFGTAGGGSNGGSAPAAEKGNPAPGGGNAAGAGDKGPPATGAPPAGPPAT